MAANLNALKHVGNFAGDEDVERWLDRMELALRIDEIPAARHADALALHLEGAAFDTWKGRKGCGNHKAELKAVFGLQRIDAWMLAVSSGSLASGERLKK